MRSLSSNLLKHFSIEAPADKEKRVIDSNGLVQRRLAKVAEETALREGRGDGFVSGLMPVEVLEAPEDGGNLIKAQDEAKEILAQARVEADSVLAGARAEAERIRKEAREQADREKLQIINQAKQQGYNEGLAKAQAHESAMEEEYLERARTLEEAYQQQADILEPRFVDTITGIYEHIFNVDLSSCREILTYLITTVLHNLEGSRSFIIHVSKDDYPYVSMQKKQMLAGVVAENTSVDVVEDLTMGKNDCMIETENGIFDCGLGTQLSELKKRLMLLAWSGAEEQ